MMHSRLRDLALAVISGAAVPYVLIAVWGGMHAAIRGPSGRIAAFLSTGLYRPRHNLGVLALDAALGMVIGVVVAVIIARFTRSGRWTLWLAFVVALLISSLAMPGAEGIGARLGLFARQPMILFVLCGASLGFWLGPRGAKASTAH
jgi:hypothetical protein